LLLIQISYFVIYLQEPYDLAAFLRASEVTQIELAMLLWVAHLIVCQRWALPSLFRV